MKKIQLTALTLALCMAFSACSRFVPSSYTRVSAHSQTKSEQMDTNVVNVDDYAGLRRAIRDFVRGARCHSRPAVHGHARRRPCRSCLLGGARGPGRRICGRLYDA